MEKVKTIKNIIFDMGGVLFDLNAKRCVEAFEAIGAKKTAVYVREFRTEDLFHLIEIKNDTTEEFCQEVRNMDGIDASDEEIITAWNALLEPTPGEKRDELMRLKSDGYRLFLLSNTNDMHWQKAKKLITNSEHDINDFFERIFLSYEMGVRKPHKEIFLQVVTDAGIRPEDSIFVDDNAMNIAAAEKLGMRTFHETADNKWVEKLRKEIA
jgi:epoxide hydrolase-like predicted phosphatase